MNRCLVLIVEGDTEVEFYKRIVSHAREKLGTKKLNTKIEYINVKGVGSKKIALRKFTKEIQTKYSQDFLFTVVLCRDTDVFEIAERPPIIWSDVEREFKEFGAKKVIHVKAKHSIEDWFLIDEQGIRDFLHIPKKTKISGSSGYRKLQNLFRLSNKVYYKGMRSDGLIEHLDIEMIATKVKSELAPLYNELGIQL